MFSWSPVAKVVRLLREREMESEKQQLPQNAQKINVELLPLML